MTDFSTVRVPFQLSGKKPCLKTANWRSSFREECVKPAQYPLSLRRLNAIIAPDNEFFPPFYIFHGFPRDCSGVWSLLCISVPASPRGVWGWGGRGGGSRKIHHFKQRVPYCLPRSPGVLSEERSFLYCEIYFVELYLGFLREQPGGGNQFT